MTVASTTVARDEIYAVLKTAWDAQTPPVPPMIYPDTIGEPPATGAWARATIRHAFDEQASFAELGSRRYTSSGILIVQIFAQVALGYATLDPLIDVVKNAFRGATTPGGIWFRNARVVEVGRDGPWEQVNVLADFEYDQIQ